MTAMPSKAKMAAEELRWRAESEVRAALEKTPGFKKEVSRVQKEMKSQQSTIQKNIAKSIKPGKKK